MSHTFEYKGWRIHYSADPTPEEEVQLVSRTGDRIIYVPYGVLSEFVRTLNIYKQISELEATL